MAGLSLRLLAGNFTNNFIASIDQPSRIGMVAEYYFGNNATQTQTNTVDGQPDGLIVGTGAVYNPYSTLLRDSGYMNSQLPSTAEQTIIVLGKKVINGAQQNVGVNGMVTNLTDPGGRFFLGMKFFSDTNFNTIQTQVGDEGPNVALTGQPEWKTRQTDLPNRAFGNPNFAFQFCRTSTAAKAIYAGYFNTASGKNEAGAGLNAPHIASATAMKIGFGGIGQEMAYMAIFNRILTDQELNTHYASLKDFYIGKINID